MQIDVSNILQQGEGHQAEYTVENETPELEGLELTKPVSGTVRIIGMDNGVIAAGQFATALQLECTRCLRTFKQPVDFTFEAEFTEHPAEDQYPIDKYGKIDLDEPVRQEIELKLPLAPLCQEDCAGIELKHKKED